MNNPNTTPYTSTYHANFVAKERSTIEALIPQTHTNDIALLLRENRGTFAIKIPALVISTESVKMMASWLIVREVSPE